MKVTPLQSASKAMLAATLLVGAIGGGAATAFMSRPAIYEKAAAAVTPVATAEAMPVMSIAPDAQPAPPANPTQEIQLTERERLVIARLANLPDLPVVKAPAFDVKVQNAEPPAETKTAAAAPTSAATPEALKPGAPKQPAGESMIARIQVVSVEKGRVFYRSVDDVMHTARAGDRLLGVNGRVVTIDEHGAELLIDGQRMRVATNNL